MVVRVGPFQRIVNVHWPSHNSDSSGSGPMDVYLIDVPPIFQWAEPSMTPTYGSDGVIVNFEEFQYVYKATGASFSDLSAPSASAYCRATGGNAEIIGSGVVPYRFFEATSGATEAGYRYEAPEGAARYYSGVNIGMDTYEYGNIFDPSPSYRVIGEVSVDISSLQMVEQTIGGQIFIPVGFFDLTFASGEKPNGTYLVLTPSAGSA